MLIMLFRITLIFCLMLAVMASSFAQHAPVRLGVVGLTHSHVHWILGSPKSDAYQIVGIMEPTTDLAERYAKQYTLSRAIAYPSKVCTAGHAVLLDQCWVPLFRRFDKHRNNGTQH